MPEGPVSALCVRACAAVRSGLVSVALGLILETSTAVAGDLNSPIDLNIPAQDLANALTALATQADLQILAPQEWVAGKRSPRVQGRISGLQALRQLLAGAGLECVVKGHDTVIVRARKAMPGRQASHATGTAVSAGKAPESSPQRRWDSPELQEVVVTAQKRVERLQDVPVAVSVVSGDVLSESQIDHSTGLVSTVSSLTFQQGMNPQNSSFRIRGIGTSLFGVGTVPSVAVVLDGVPMARQAQSFFNLSDVERIEVLRGPQGTLFGEGASAGVINVVTGRPSASFAGWMNATFAQAEEYRVNSTITGPLSDSLSARLTGYYNNIRGILPEVGTSDWENGARDWGSRAKLLWNATDHLAFYLNASFAHDFDTCCAAVLIRSVNPTMRELNPGVTVSPTNRAVEDDQQTFSETRQQLYSLQADLDFGAATLTSITGYQKYDLLNNNEVDQIRNPTPVHVGGNSGAAFAQFNINGGDFSLSQSSQELRIASNGAGRLNYVGGLYLQDLLIDRRFIRSRAYCAPGTAAQVGVPCTPLFEQSYNNWTIVRSGIEAAFGQIDYQLSGALKVIAGLRIQHEDIAASGAPGGVNGTGLLAAADHAYGSAVAGRRSTSDTALSGKAGFQYGFSRNAQAYATYTRGFKGAGFNVSPITNYATQLPVVPERVNAYEVGFKGLFWDGAFTLDAAAFLEEYSKLQVQVAVQDPIAGTLVATQTNAGTSSTKGLEIESTLRPVIGLSIGTEVTLAKTSIDLDGLGCPLEFQSAAVPLTGAPPINRCYVEEGQALLNVRGGQLPASPTWRVGITPRYQHSLGRHLLGFAQIKVDYQSSEVFDLTQDPLLKQNGYTLVGSSLGVSSDDDRYGITFFVKNLCNEYYYTSMQHGLLLATATQPYDIYANLDKKSLRYFGVRLRWRF